MAVGGNLRYLKKQYHSLCLALFLFWFACLLWCTLGWLSRWSLLLMAFFIYCNPNLSLQRSLKQNIVCRSSIKSNKVLHVPQLNFMDTTCWENYVFLFIHHLFCSSNNLGTTFLTANSIFYSQTNMWKLISTFLVKKRLTSSLLFGISLYRIKSLML